MGIYKKLLWYLNYGNFIFSSSVATKEVKLRVSCNEDEPLGAPPELATKKPPRGLSLGFDVGSLDIV